MMTWLDMIEHKDLMITQWYNDKTASYLRGELTGTDRALYESLDEMVIKSKRRTD